MSYEEALKIASRPQDFRLMVQSLGLGPPAETAEYTHNVLSDAALEARERALKLSES